MRFSRSSASSGAKRVARRLLSPQAYKRLAGRYRRQVAWPPPGRVDFGDLHRVSPVSRVWGQERGLPIDRYYIEDFLKRASSSADGNSLVRGRVLEIGNARYAPALGHGAIERLDILDPSPDNPDATLTGDLSDAPNLPTDAFDCIICTQTLLLIFDIDAAVRTLHRILRPGGWLFVTVPGISQICQPEMEIYGDYWRFTTASVQSLFESTFEPGDLSIESRGNVLAASSFLFGLAANDLSPAELDALDPDYQLVICAVARKRAA